jgi:hypothetical protein
MEMQKTGKQRPAARPFAPHVGPGEDPFGGLAEAMPARPLGMGLSSTVAQKITAFAAEKGNGAWPNLSRSDIANRLAMLQKTPANVRQYKLNACGPAAAMYVLATRDFGAFADLVIDLYNTGSGAFGTLTVKSSGLEKLDPMAFPTDAFPNTLLLDWMLLASLRKTSNDDFDGTPEAAWDAITWPSDMVSWLKSGVGFAKVEDQTTDYFIFNESVDDLKALKMSSDVQPILFVNVSLLLDKGGKKGKRSAKKMSKSHMAQQGIFGKIGEKGTSLFPNHWAPLLEPITDVTKPVKVWSWGGTEMLPPANDAIWEEAYFGAVVART